MAKYRSSNKRRKLPEQLWKLYTLEAQLLGRCPLVEEYKAYWSIKPLENSKDCRNFTGKDCKYASVGYICSINARIRYYGMLRKGGIANGINTKTGE